MNFYQMMSCLWGISLLMWSITLLQDIYYSNSNWKMDLMIVCIALLLVVNNYLLGKKESRRLAEILKEMDDKKE